MKKYLALLVYAWWFTFWPSDGTDAVLYGPYDTEEQCVAALNEQYQKDPNAPAEIECYDSTGGDDEEDEG